MFIISKEQHIFRPVKVDIIFSSLPGQQATI